MPPTLSTPIRLLAGAFSLPLACLLSLSPGTAQETDSDSTFFEELDVDVVSVEVFVTDRDGNPVPGLTRDDFEVFDEGRKVEITNFYTSEMAAGAVPGTMAGEEAASETQAPAGAGAAPAQSLHLAVFFDNETLTDRLRQAAQESLRGFLASSLGPRDSLTVVRYDGRGRVSQHPVAMGDAAALEAAFKEVNASPPQGQTRNAELRELLRQIEMAPGWEEGAQRNGGDIALSDAQSTLERVRDFTKKRYNEVENTLAALEGVTRTLAPLPGRKALLFVSGGLPVIPGQAVGMAWQSKYGGRGVRRIGLASLEVLTVDATDLYKKLGDTANANGVTFYAIGSPNEANAASAEFGRSRVWTSGMSTADRDQALQSMLLVSVPTGGMADPDSIKPEGFLQKMSRDLGSYYSLGFAPASLSAGAKGGKAGQVRGLKIRVKTPGLQVRHRQTYRTQSAPERMQNRVLSALLAGPRKGDGTQDNPLGVSLELEQETAPPGGAKAEVQVGLLLKLPMSGLVLLPQETFHEGRVMVYLASKDARGQLSDVTQIAIPVRVPNDQILAALGQTVAYRTSLRLRRSPHTIAVSVRDELSKVASTATVLYTPGEAAGAAGASR